VLWHSYYSEVLNGPIATVWPDRKVYQKQISRVVSKLPGYILLIDAKYLSGCLGPNFMESDLDVVDSETQVNDAPTTPARHPFFDVPSTPSSMDPALLQRANTALMDNIEGGIFDTPSCAFIPKLVKAIEYHSAQVLLVNHENTTKDNIL